MENRKRGMARVTTTTISALVLVFLLHWQGVMGRRGSSRIDQTGDVVDERFSHASDVFLDENEEVVMSSQDLLALLTMAKELQDRGRSLQYYQVNTSDPLQVQVLELDVREDELQLSIDTVWVIVTAIGILSLQTGFTMLEAGTVRAKNVKSVLMKNMVDSVFGGVLWYCFGYGLYKGDNPYFVGQPALFFIDDATYFPEFVQQFGFAVTAATIVSGGILSRVKFELYVIFSIIFIGFVYPIGAHWAWSDNGFLDTEFGYVDFAGSGVVHMVGGIAGLIGAWLAGPRVGRFYDLGDLHPGDVRPLPEHSSVLIVLGVFLLYIGWFSFNAGSSAGMDPEQTIDASRAAMNTLLAPSCSGSVAVLYGIIVGRKANIPLAVNGIISGLVAITGPCATVATWAACLIGAASALTYVFTSWFVLYKLRIDDPLNVFAVHGVAGALGVLLTGGFAKNDGLFYGGGFNLMLGQIVGVLVLGIWSALCSYAIFKALKSVFGLTLSEEDQLLGLDIKYHSGFAYPDFDTFAVREFNAERLKKLRNPGSGGFDRSESEAGAFNSMFVKTDSEDNMRSRGVSEDGGDDDEYV